MKIIISPAKRMQQEVSFMNAKTFPFYLKETKKLLSYLKTLSPEQLAKELCCSKKIAQDAYNFYHSMDLKHNTLPALLAFDGIQYSYMAPHVFSNEYYAYIEQHLFILSAFYGILRPFDGIKTYRLEMISKLQCEFARNLYDFWQDKPYQLVTREDHDILDLASVEYGKLIHRYQQSFDHIVRCRFMEEEDHTLKEKGVYVKMARGEMVRYLAEIQAESFEDVKKFSRLHYRYREDLSRPDEFVFTRSCKH